MNVPLSALALRHGTDDNWRVVRRHARRRRALRRWLAIAGAGFLLAVAMGDALATLSVRGW